MKTKINLQLAMLFIAVFIGANTFAQGLYVYVGAGYGFPAAPYLMGANGIYNSNETGKPSEYEIVKGSGSFGKGIQPSVLIGYIFNSNIGAELGFGYLFGGKYNEMWETNLNNGPSFREDVSSAKMMRFTPALKIAVGNRNIRPYMRTGLVIGVAGKIMESSKRTYSGDFNQSIYETEIEYKGGISLGFAGALGTDFILSDNIGIFAEMGIITQSWAPKKSEITKYTIDGQDQLDNMTTNDREVEFVDSYTRNSGYVDENSPSEELKIYFPFSSFGINVGVRIALGGSSK